MICSRYSLHPDQFLLLDHRVNFYSYYQDYYNYNFIISVNNCLIKIARLYYYCSFASSLHIRIFEVRELGLRLSAAGALMACFELPMGDRLSLADYFYDKWLSIAPIAFRNRKSQSRDACQLPASTCHASACDGE